MLSFFKKHRYTISAALADYQDGNYVAAHLAAEYLLKKNPSDAAVQILMGNLCFVAGAYADAVKYYRCVLQTDSQNQSVLMNLFEALLRQKNMQRLSKFFHV